MTDSPAPSPARLSLEDQLQACLRDHGLTGRLACPKCDADLVGAAEEFNGFITVWPTVQNGHNVVKNVIARVAAEPPRGGGE